MTSPPKDLQLLLPLFTVEVVLVDDVQVLATLLRQQYQLSLPGDCNAVEGVALLGDQVVHQLHLSAHKGISEKNAALSGHDDRITVLAMPDLAGANEDLLLWLIEEGLLGLLHLTLLLIELKLHLVDLIQ